MPMRMVGGDRCKRFFFIGDYEELTIQERKGVSFDMIIKKVREIVIDEITLFDNAININSIFPGFISWTDINNLEWSMYKHLINRANKRAKEVNNG